MLLRGAQQTLNLAYPATSWKLLALFSLLLLLNKFGMAAFLLLFILVTNLAERLLKSETSSRVFFLSE